jgi:cytochrome P450
MNTVLQIVASAVPLYLLYLASCLFRNYNRAKSSGFPLRLFLFNIGTPVFSIFGGLFLPVVTRLLPQSWSRTFDLGVYGVEWRDRVAKRERETPGYLVVSPFEKLELFIEDGELANAILTRRREFEQDEAAMKIMNLMGPSLAGSKSEAWSRQRRLIAPMLNERIMKTVWSESQQQSNDMMAHFLQKDGGSTSGTVTGLRTIAFNILSTIGYGMPSKWTAEDAKKQSSNDGMDYMESLLHLVDGLILLALFPPWLLKQFWMPTALRRIGEAYYEFFRHSSKLLEKERDTLASSGAPRNNFLSSLASINDEGVDGYEKERSQNRPAFTEDEITGNMYTFTLAGYDTTANTMAYAFAMVAVNPQWQEWIVEEINRVKKEVSDPTNYLEVFPKLDRCLALMVSSSIQYQIWDPHANKADLV